MKFSITSLIFIFFVSQATIAQVSKSSNSSMRRSVATVMFSGLAGAVLGLSTLSFYGEPQENINNIWTGLAVGTLAGGIYVISANSKQNQSFSVPPTNPHQISKSQVNLVQYSWTF